MTEARTYQGSCQCGTVRYDVEMTLDRLVSCNCSRCGRLGAVLGFTTPDNFTLHSGHDNLQEYLFNKRVIRHLFCKICGIESFARGQLPDGTPMIAINVNCLDDVDVKALATLHYDGKNA